MVFGRSETYIDALVEREGRRVRIERNVGSRVGGGVEVRLSQARDKLLNVSLSLRCSDGRAQTLIPREGDVVVLLVDLELLLGEQRAELGISKRVRFVGAELKHRENVVGGEGEVARDVGREALSCGVEVGLHEFRGGRSADRAVCVVRVRAGLFRREERSVEERTVVRSSTHIVRSTRVVGSGLLDRDLDADLVEILGNAEESSSEVVHRL